MYYRIQARIPEQNVGRNVGIIRENKVEYCALQTKKNKTRTPIHRYGDIPLWINLNTHSVTSRWKKLIRTIEYAAEVEASLRWFNQLVLSFTNR